MIAVKEKKAKNLLKKMYDFFKEGLDTPMVCPQCGGTLKIIAFLTDYAVVVRIIDHLKLSFVADKPSPLHLAYHEVLMAAEASTEYSS